jgi:hypothetical protein
MLWSKEWLGYRLAFQGIVIRSPVALKKLYLRLSVHTGWAAHRAPRLTDREFERSGNAADRCRCLLRRSGTSDTKPAPPLYVHNQNCNIGHSQLSEFWVTLCAVSYHCRLLKECKYYYDYRYNYCFPIFGRGKCVQQNSKLSYFFPELCLIALLNRLCRSDERSAFRSAACNTYMSGLHFSLEIAL